MKKALAGFVGLMMLCGAAYADEQVEAKRWWDGVYVAAAIGQALNIGGGMTADAAYKLNTGLPADMFPRTNFQNNGVRPIQFSIGKAINNDFRVEVSYLNYHRIFMPYDFGDQPDGSSDVAMLNVYHNLDSYIGSFLYGKLRPYVGAGVGMSFNAMSGFSHYDSTFYGTRLASGTTQSLAYALEAGVTSELNNGLSFDFFVRWANLGSVVAVGDIYIVGPTVGDWHDWQELGTLHVLDMGVRLRLQF